MPGDRALVAQHALELLAALPLEDVAERLEGEVVGERVRAEAGDAGHVVRVAHDVHRQALLGAGLGDVEARLVVEHDAGRHAATCCWAWAAAVGTSSRQRIQPAAGQVDDQVQPGDARSRGTCRAGSRPRPCPPSSARSGGSKVLSALNAAMCTVAMARSASRPLRSRARASTSGSSGTSESRCTGSERPRAASGGHPNLVTDDPGSDRSTRPTGASWEMPAGRPLPEVGSVFLDARGDDRALRVSWHSEADLVVLSLWRDNVCTASFRLADRRCPRADRHPHRARHSRRAALRPRSTAAREPRAGLTPRVGDRRESTESARQPRYRPIVDPIRNPYAPGAGQRPPELAGRDEQLRAFDVVLERVAKGRPERSLVLTGLRGVGKTVLLNALRSPGGPTRAGAPASSRRDPTSGCAARCPVALHQAVRELAHPEPEQSDHVLGVLRSFAEREAGPGAKLRDRWSPGIDVPAVRGRADSGDIEIDLVELLTDVGGLAADLGKGVAVCIDEMQDLGPDDVSALCAACHEISQSGLPVIVVGAGLPHLPAVLSASKSYSERLFSYQRIDRLSREEADRALTAPAREEDAAYDDEALAAMYAATGGYPYFIQAYGKTVWDLAPRSPITATDVAVAAPEAERELAVGFFGSRYERATPGERDYLRAMADAAVELGADATRSARSPRPTWPGVLGKKPQSLSPARDSLLKKGLIYSGERGRIAFTVPHFGRYLRAQA